MIPETLAGAIPGGDLVLLVGATHHAAVEYPEEVAGHLRRFVQRTSHHSLREGDDGQPGQGTGTSNPQASPMADSMLLFRSRLLCRGVVKMTLPLWMLGHHILQPQRRV